MEIPMEVDVKTGENVDDGVQEAEEDGQGELRIVNMEVEVGGQEKPGISSSQESSVYGSQPMTGDTTQNTSLNESVMEEIPESERIQVMADGGIMFHGIYIPKCIEPTLSCDPTGPRLVITHIETFNFKSYAGRHIFGPLHKNFTCIMGQNGSGKSNVIDSLLFVFGGQAKSLRAGTKKLSSLIHNSTDHKNLDMCNVAIGFCKVIDKGPNELEVCADSQLVISRSITRNDVSTYYINKKRVGYQQVTATLKKYGIDMKNNRFLILQGEVEKISQMKAKGANDHEPGMLEYLEDIIGTDRYVEPLQQLQGKIQALQNEIDEKETSVKLAEEEVKQLEEPKNKAVEHMMKANDSKVYQHQTFQHEMFQNQKKIKAHEDEKQKIEEENSELTNRFEEVMKDKKEKLGLLKNLEVEFNQINAASDSNKEQLQKLNLEDEKVRADLRNSIAALKKKEKKIEIEEEKIAENEKVPSTNAAKVQELEKHKVKLEKQRDMAQQDYEAKMGTLEKQNEEMRKEKEVIDKQRVEMQEALNDAKKEMDLRMSELHMYKSSHENAKKTLRELTLTFEQNHEKKTENEKTQTTLQKRLPQLNSELEQRKNRLFELRDVWEGQEQLANAARRKFDEASSNAESIVTGNKVLNELKKLKMDGKLPGFFDRLGNLGTIDKKYDVAISTACGALENFVVDTNETAKQCVNILKAKNLGTASFIMLDQMENNFGNQSRSRIHTPEQMPRLYDLINIKEEKFRPAFYYGIRNTLVARDKDQASRVAQGATRHRVVTLDGVVFETSGTFSGGGRPRSGRMGSVIPVSKEEIDALKRKRDEASKKLEETRQGIQEQERMIQKLEQERKEAQITLSKLPLEIKSCLQIALRAKDDVTKQREKVEETKVDQVKLKEMEELVEAATAVYKKRKTKSEEKGKEAKKIAAKMQEKTAERMGGAKTQRNKVLDQIKKVNEEIVKANGATKNAERQLKMSRKEVDTLKNDIEKLTEKKGELEKQKEELEKTFKEVVEKQKEMEHTKIPKMKEKGKQISEQIKVCEEQENSLKLERVKIDNEVEKVQAKIRDLKSMNAGIKKAMSKIKLDEIPVDVNMPADGEEVQQKQWTLRMLSEEELEQLDIHEIKLAKSLLDEHLSHESPNLKVVDEYKRKESQFKRKKDDLDLVLTEHNSFKTVKMKVENRRLEEFKVALDIINLKLKQVYKMLTLGGTAILEYKNSYDPFDHGITFSVRPPKKAWKHISSLSGGEKTLSSLALIFSLHYYRNTPFHVMDEIDAALDERNVSIVAEYVKEQTKNSQFIIISLRPRMCARANLLTGIIKRDDISKSVAVAPDDVLKKRQPEEEGS